MTSSMIMAMSTSDDSPVDSPFSLSSSAKILNITGIDGWMSMF